MKQAQMVTLLDKETGEFQDFIAFDENYKLVHKNSAESYKEQKRIEELKTEMRGKKWVACYHNPIKEISKEMTLTEAGAVLKLLPYLQFNNDGKITNEGEEIGLKEMASVLGKGITQTKAIINRLEELKIIEKQKVGRNNVYFISKMFHTIGETLEGMKFTKLYQKKTKEILDELKLNEAGLLYKMLPYFHYSEYCLSKNPDEKDGEKVDMLTREELAELIGHEAETVTRYMNALIRQHVVLKMTDSKAVNYYVHPDVMFRKQAEDEKTEQVRAMFTQFFERLKRSKKAKK